MNSRIVMLLTNSFNPDVRVYKEAIYLIERGFNVTILCWDKEADSTLPENTMIDGIHVLRFKIKSRAGQGIRQLLPFYKYILMCKKFLNNYDCDYIHCNDLDGSIAGYCSRKGKTKMVFDMHEFYEKGSSISRYMWRKITIFLLKKSVAGLYENDVYLGEEYKEVHDKLFPLKNYPDSRLLNVLPKTYSSVFRVGYHGAVRSQVAQFHALFEAVKDMNDVRVDINGGGIDLPILKQLKKKYSNVFIHGPFDGTRALGDLYANTDVLFCGYDPNNPNMQKTAEIVKYFEALITGTPMIATESLAVGKRVKEQRFGIACDTLNPISIRKAIELMKEDAQLREEFSTNEILNSKQYDWQEAVKVLDGIYK